MPKTVIITGASGNLGTASVLKMLANGFRVIAISNKHSSMDISEKNGLYEQYSVDLGREQETQAFVEEMIAKYGKIDAALLLAGGFAMGDIEKTSSEDLKAMYALNFETAYHIARPLFTHMLSKGFGRIVFVGARPVLEAAKGKAVIAYALSKSLLFELSAFMNEAARGTNLVTSVIVPSTIDTPPNRQAMPEADFESWVKPEDIAELMAFICCEKSASIREPVYKVYNNS